jgi:hypothetical protein
MWERKKKKVGFDNLYDVDHNGKFELNLHRLLESDAAKKKLAELAKNINNLKLDNE